MCVRSEIMLNAYHPIQTNILIYVLIKPNQTKDKRKIPNLKLEKNTQQIAQAPKSYKITHKRTNKSKIINYTTQQNTTYKMSDINTRVESRTKYIMQRYKIRLHRMLNMETEPTALPKQLFIAALTTSTSIILK